MASRNTSAMRLSDPFELLCRMTSRCTLPSSSRSGKRWYACHTWLFLGIILGLGCFHCIQHGICILAVLLRSVCCVQGSVCPVLVSISCEAVCMDMLWLPGCTLTSIGFVRLQILNH